jgi:hypothetical protein
MYRAATGKELKEVDVVRRLGYDERAATGKELKAQLQRGEQAGSTTASRLQLGKN